MAETAEKSELRSALKMQDAGKQRNTKNKLSFSTEKATNKQDHHTWTPTHPPKPDKDQNENNTQLQDTRAHAIPTPERNG